MTCQELALRLSDLLERKVGFIFGPGSMMGTESIAEAGRCRA